MLPRPRILFRLTGLLVAAVLTLGGSEASAQGALELVNNDTQVRAIAFRFDSTETLDPEILRTKIATRAPQLGLFERLYTAVGLQDVPNAYQLVPIEVKKDVVRLTRYFQENGFPRVSVDYDVEFDPEKNDALVAFLINEGPPQLIDDITFGLPGSGGPAAQLPPELRPEWDTFVRETILATGTRFDEFSLVGLQNQTLRWFSSRGYPFAYVGAERFVEGDGLRVTIRLKANVGPRARIGSVTVEGAEGLNERIVKRELPFREGDIFDSRKLVEAQRQIFGLNLFRLALVALTADQPQDSTVAVTVSLNRGPTRVLSGFGGYFSEGGVTARGQLTHRNVLGGAQALTLGVEARTGLFGRAGEAASGNAITDYRASLSLRQPYVFDRRFSGTLQPSVRQRDDEIERSRQTELSTSVLYSRTSVQTAAVTLTGRNREVLLGEGLSILDPESILNTNSLTSLTGGLGFDVTWGKLDNPLQPRSGFVVRPSLSGAIGDVTYLRSRISGTYLIPIGRRSGLVGRVTAGRLVPFGGSDQSDAGTGRAYLRFRDVLFYAGGTSDVRGWNSARLGPKTLTISRNSDGAIADAGDIGSLGIGVNRKVSASLQLNLPLPLGDKWGVSLFTDAGRVWDPNPVPLSLLRNTGNQADAALAAVLDQENGIRVGSGIGIQYLTPVGYVSVAVAFKVNPSYLDLRDPAVVYCGSSALAATFSCTGSRGEEEIIGYADARQFDEPFDPEAILPTTIGRFQTRRLNFHLTIGQTF